MKKILVILVAILLSVVPMMAQDFSGVACQQGQVYDHWQKWLDHINIVQPIDIYQYEKMYLCPPDVSGVQWPDKSDNKYPALEQSLDAFSGIIAKNIKKQFPHLKVVTVNSLDEMKLDDKSVGLCLRFDESPSPVSFLTSTKRSFLTSSIDAKRLLAEHTKRICSWSLPISEKT